MFKIDDTVYATSEDFIYDRPARCAHGIRATFIELRDGAKVAVCWDCSDEKKALTGSFPIVERSQR